MTQFKQPHNVLEDLLTELGVPHTHDYTAGRLSEMAFQTWFGLSKLLKEYGVGAKAYNISDKDEIASLTPPFIADTKAGEVIVTKTSPDSVSYLTQGVEEEATKDEFLEAWSGKVMLVFPTKDSIEPAFHKHERLAFLMKAKRWVLAACLIFLFLYLFIGNGLYRNVWNYFLTAINIGGLYFTYLLVQKSLRIHNPAADRVCGVLQAGGCDSILETKASKFFGLFGWSEVGFAYFSVSLITMLLLPFMLPRLALCNLCCLPFTVWSIWYQRFRAHKWCTLCVCVQCSLWLLFFSYLFGGYIREAFPISWNFIALGAAYIGVMLGINALMPLVENKTSEEGGTE